MIDVYDLPYTVNKLWEVWSKEMVIRRASRRWGSADYIKQPQKLKVDWKEREWHLLWRVQLYDLEWWRKCYYVARLVYALYNWIPYEMLTQIHYKDWNSRNLRLDNLIHSAKGMIREKFL